MLDELIDQAWRCFNKTDKKPPDRSAEQNVVAETLKRRSSLAGPIILNPGALPDRQRLDAEFKQLLVDVI